MEIFKHAQKDQQNEKDQDEAEIAALLLTNWNL